MLNMQRLKLSLIKENKAHVPNIVSGFNKIGA